MYLVSDPLGLLGGEQTYRYVPNPLRWIDPLGLNKGASLSKMMNSSSDLMGVEKAAPELPGGYIAEKTFNNSITKAQMNSECLNILEPKLRY